MIHKWNEIKNTFSPERKAKLDQEVNDSLNEIHDETILEWNKIKNTFKSKQDRIDWQIANGISTFESVYQLIETEKKLGKSREQLLEEANAGTLNECEWVSDWWEYYSEYCWHKKEMEPKTCYNLF